MRIAIVGGHGRVARLLSRELAARGDVPLALVRNLDHVADVQDDGAEPVVLDLERVNAHDVARAVAGADAIVFAAGAGAGSGAPRKDTVDRAGARLAAEGAQESGVRRFLLVSSMGAQDPPSEEDDGSVFGSYLRAKAASEQDLRRRDLDWTVLRPGILSDGPAGGRVRLEPSVPRGEVSRADVAAVLAALVHEPRTAGLTLELTHGPTPVRDALAGVVVSPA